MGERPQKWERGRRNGREAIQMGERPQFVGRGHRNGREAT